MILHELIDAKLQPNSSGVWMLEGHSKFAYSDGRTSERYLHDILSSAKDLTDGSGELEAAIKDWPSEYHLSPIRSRLLSGFRFSPTARVLEVGCGCGAITRYLGESFQEVIAVEGSSARAELARLRTKDLPGVTIICAPFQELRFQAKFDLIFCIGVFEYASAFVTGPDPHEKVIRCLKDWLAPGGSLVVAIENQFGLKYLNGFREDHLGIRYEGLEGYHTQPQRVRTFGKTELTERMRRHFQRIDFFYPFPDYKLPSCVTNHEFLSCTDSGELISQIASRCYAGPEKGHWDEDLVALEISRNKQLPFFANSFLAIASSADNPRYTFEQSAISFTDQRAKEWRTVTRILATKDGKRVVSKKLRSGQETAFEGPLRWIGADSEWQTGESLQTELFRRCRNTDLSLTEIFSPCASWLQALEEISEEHEGTAWLPGNYVDAMWSNFYCFSGEHNFVDLEWQWESKIPLNAIVIRAVFVFLSRLHGRRALNVSLLARSGKMLTKEIAASMGVRLGTEDFAQFIELESEFSAKVKNSGSAKNKVVIKWFLFDRFSLYGVMRTKNLLSRFAEMLTEILRALRDRRS